jgi:hypothetical protein
MVYWFSQRKHFNTYGDVMLTEDKGSKVWKVNCLGPRKEFFDASPFGTRCMCLAKNGDILLCLQAKGADGKIVRLSPNLYRYDQTCHLLVRVE